MGDWELRELSELIHWDQDEDRKCLWFKATMLGGRRQRCSRRLRRNDWERDGLLTVVNADISGDILPQDDMLTRLAGVLLCPRDHNSERNRIELCRQWVSAWEDRVDDDEDDEDYEDYESDEVDEGYEVDEDDEREDEVIQISVENAFDYDAQESSTSSRVPEPVTPPIYEAADFQDSGFFEGKVPTRDETSETPSRASRASSISRAEDSPATPRAPTTNPLETPPAATLPPPVQPALSAHHSSPQVSISSHALSTALVHTLESDLTSTELARKTLYAFRTSATSPLLKIGITADFPYRMAALHACGFDTAHVAFCFETNHAARVQKLLQLHLARERRQEIGGLGSHAEWFEVSDERAERVAGGWARWMGRWPYHEGDDVEFRSLREKWRAMADVVEDQVGEEDEDPWMLWLERHAPEPAPDAVVEEKAEEAEVSPLATDVSGDSSDSLLPSPTSPSVLDLAAPQSSSASAEATASAPTATRTQPFISHPAAQHQRHTPNLVVQFVARSLQLFLLLGIAGNMSFVQFCSIVLLAVLTLPFAGGSTASSLDVAGWDARVVA